MTRHGFNYLYIDVSIYMLIAYKHKRAHLEISNLFQAMQLVLCNSAFFRALTFFSKIFLPV